jgi:hypothetical protein
MPIPIAPPTSNSVRIEHPTPKGGVMLHWLCSVIFISATSRINIKEAIGFPGSSQAYASGWVGSRYSLVFNFYSITNINPSVCISFGFPFLFFKEKHLFLSPVTIPEPTQRHWNDRGDKPFILLRSTIGKASIMLLYLAFNIYVVIDPIIPPYVDGNGNMRQVQGWWYLAITASIVTAATVYYFAVFGLTIDASGDINLAHQKRTVLRAARAYPSLHEAAIHEPHYGVRRWVEIIKPSVVSSLHAERKIISINILVDPELCLLVLWWL